MTASTPVSGRSSDLLQLDQNGLPASQSEMSMTPNGLNPHRRVSQMTASAASDRSHSPISRTGTPQHDPNIAPQHLFDGAAMDNGHFNGSPSLPGLGLSQPSPGLNLEAPMSYDALLAANTTLRTRVSELEVINMVYSDNENNLRSERDRAIQENDELKRKIGALESQLQQATANDFDRPAKKQRLSDEP